MPNINFSRSYPRILQPHRDPQHSLIQKMVHAFPRPADSLHIVPLRRIQCLQHLFPFIRTEIADQIDIFFRRSMLRFCRQFYPAFPVMI